MIEEWRSIAGHEGCYEVSNLGHVRSLDRVVVRTHPTCPAVIAHYKGRMLRPNRSTRGHLTVMLGGDNRQRIHCLVLETFVGPAPAGYQARHLSGDESDNSLSNLKWDTQGNNGRDKKWHKGQVNYKLSPDQVREIKLELAKGRPYGLTARLARRYGVTWSAIYAIREDQVHTDVSITGVFA